MLMILSFWHPPTEQCGICWLFVTNLLVNIMLFSMLKSQSVCILIRVLIVLVFLPPCPTSLSAAIIDREFVTSAKKIANFNEFSEIKKIPKNS